MQVSSQDLKQYDLLNEFPLRERTLRKTRPRNRGLGFIFSVCLFAIGHWNASAQSQYQSSTDFAKFAIKLRENGLLTFQPGLGSGRIQHGSPPRFRAVRRTRAVPMENRYRDHDFLDW